MPPLKQPGPLQDLAMDALITFLSNCCQELKAANSLDKLRQSIAFMKTDTCPNIPLKLSADFHERFLLKFRKFQNWPINFPRSHMSAVFEIMMDREIVGLKCTEDIAASLNPDHLHRIQGLKELDMSSFVRAPVRYSIEKFNLQDITTINYRFSCTDTELKVIGRNCLKLEHLDVSHSREVTDNGLRSLVPCKELRIFSIIGCGGISHDGIIGFLSAHEKIEKLSAWDNSSSKGFEGFSRSGSQAYPSIKSLGIRLDPITSPHLIIIPVKFPNLTSLRLMGRIAGDLKILKSLGKLSQLDLSSCPDLGSTQTQFDLGKLLIFIGTNITDLRLCCGSSQACVTQKLLNFMFKYCANMERLHIDYWPSFRWKNLLVPPFQKLKRFQCLISRQYRNSFVELTFGRMPNLEQLTVFRTDMSHQSLASIVLDDFRFPNLKLIEMHEVSGNYDLELIRQIVRDRNLDFHISDMFMFE